MNDWKGENEAGSMSELPGGREEEITWRGDTEESEILFRKFLTILESRTVSFSSMIKFLVQGVCFVVFNLKDAYFHIIQSHSKYLWFRQGSKVFHYESLPFGLATALKVLIKCIVVVVVHLCTHLDEYFIVALSCDLIIANINFY